MICSMTEREHSDISSDIISIFTACAIDPGYARKSPLSAIYAPATTSGSQSIASNHVLFSSCSILYVLAFPSSSMGQSCIVTSYLLGEWPTFSRALNTGTFLTGYGTSPLKPSISAWGISSSVLYFQILPKLPGERYFEWCICEVQHYYYQNILPLALIIFTPIF